MQDNMLPTIVQTVFGIAAVLFIVIAIFAISGFLRVRRFSDRVMTLAESELARRAQEEQAKAKQAEPKTCLHCQGQFASNLTNCPNCGASAPRT